MGETMGQIGHIEWTFQQRLEQIVSTVGSAIEDYIGRDRNSHERLKVAMLYSIRAKGKRFRPIMVTLAAEACGGDGGDQTALPAAVAIELMHTYSLIHDDLPAMDDDDLRRGMPTNHKVFGQAVAILAGDAILTYAMGIPAMYAKNDHIARQLTIELAQAGGAAGMIGGQIADLLAAQTARTLENVEFIHKYKTAVMFRAAGRMGAISAQADRQTIDMLGEYGLKVGLAYQIVDDLLDVTASTQELGKQTQKDEKAGKLTYPSVVGITAAAERVETLCKEAIQTIAPLGDAAEQLIKLVRLTANRKN